MRTSTRLNATEDGSTDPDTLDDLQLGHRRLEALFARAGMVGGTKRSDLIGMILAELDHHASLEDKVVDTLLGAVSPPASEHLAPAPAHNEEVRSLAATLGASAEAAVPAALRALHVALLRHVALTEGELFPSFRRLVSPERLRQLAADASQECNSAGAAK